jgi:hypothetical protein
MNTDQRINMSLDDLIKVRNQQPKPKRNNSAGGNSNSNNNNKKKQVKTGGAVNAARANQAGAKKVRAPRQSRNNGSSMDVDVRVAKSVGAGRAKRSAQVNTRRGLQSAPEASKNDIRKEVNKQLQKKRPASANAAAPAGLKISFRPKELAQTTERVVSQQIKAVLSRQPSPRANSNSNPAGRSGPKSRGNNKVIRVLH